MPLPGGITSTFLNACLVQLMKSGNGLRCGDLRWRGFFERLRIEAATFHGQRMVDDQLHRHHWIHLGWITALLGDCVAQASQIHQRGLAQDVVAYHARRKPREVQIALALDQLFQRIGQRRRIGGAPGFLPIRASVYGSLSQAPGWMASTA